MKLTLGEIAKLVDGELVGSPDIVITGISGIKEAKEGDITFLSNSKYSPLMENTCASAIITSTEIERFSKAIIKTNNPSLAFTKVVNLVVPNYVNHPKGIHPTAVISPGVQLGKNVGIGAYVIIEGDVVIGDDSVIYGGCFIGQNSRIGSNCLIYPTVTIRERTEIGNNVIVHSGTVIGSDGFGFASVGGVPEKIPQIGIVFIDDDVEIGANVTIDRARFDKTIIGKRTKIDNLVQIAHNVVIGEDCFVIAQAGISGSTIVGKKVIIAGQAGLVGHISIGDGVIIAAQAGVTKSIPKNTKVSGYPAKPHEAAARVNACVQKLPELYKRIKNLEAKIRDLEEKSNR